MADPGFGEVVGGGVDAVGVVVDVGSAVVVAVDAHGGPGGGHELHQPLRAGGAGVVVAAVPGFFHADAGQQRPGDLVPVCGGQVQLFDLWRDGQRRVVQRIYAAGFGGVDRKPDTAFRSVPTGRATPAMSAFLDGAMALPSRGAPRSAMNRTGLTGVAVDLDLEVEVQSGAGSGGALDAEPLPDPTTAPGTMLRSMLARCP